MPIKMYIPKPEEWFIKRIGKRIYRDKYKCCPTCDEIAENGIVVIDQQQAEYMAMCDTDFGAEGRFLNYRDKK